MILTSNGTSQTASSGIPKSANTDMEEDVSAIEEVPFLTAGPTAGCWIRCFVGGFACFFFCVFWVHLKFRSFMFQICVMYIYIFIDIHHVLLCCWLILSIYLLFICISRERERDRELFDQLCSVFLFHLPLPWGLQNLHFSWYIITWFFKWPKPFFCGWKGAHGICSEVVAGWRSGKIVSLLIHERLICMGHDVHRCSVLLGCPRKLVNGL